MPEDLMTLFTVAAILAGGILWYVGMSWLFDRAYRSNGVKPPKRKFATSWEAVAVLFGVLWISGRLSSGRIRYGVMALSFGALSALAAYAAVKGIRSGTVQLRGKYDRSSSPVAYRLRLSALLFISVLTGIGAIIFLGAWSQF